ncbi:MAG: acyl-CoA dehydrogenase family protein [Anaerolineae bacterium]|nr:acyl-CoA dehydrogenase family protein [Anaerolineae bacterium]
MVSFAATEEQEMIVDSVRDFAREQLRNVMREADDSGDIPADIIETGWGLGIVPALIPEQYGGFAGEYSAVTGALVGEELAYGDLAGAVYLLSPLSVAIPILLGGTEEQKHEYLPRFAADTFVPATAALIEPRITYDPMDMYTTAVKDGDVYLLNGAKAYVPLAASAGMMLVWAKEGDTTQGFLVDLGAAGITIGEREKNMGIKGLPTYKVRFQDVHVSPKCKLGGEAGVDFETMLDHSRVAMSALAVGVGKAALEYAMTYAKEREAFGAPIATRQAIAFMLAEMQTDLDGGRLLVWEAAWRLDQGLEATREARLAKTFMDDTALMCGDRSVQILGGHGYIRDHPVELWLRNARAFGVLDGLAMV